MPEKVMGVSFGDAHSYRDWGLKLKKIDIGLPEVKTEYVDVPGMNGSLDLAEAQNGGVKYGMRTLEFTFGVRNCSYQKWGSLISRIASDLHGVSKKIILDIDSGYYYTGRCSIDTEKTNDVTAEIVITCNCDPFKWSVATSEEAWKWDIFSFSSGVIRSTKDIAINASESSDGWQTVTLIGWKYNDTLKIISDSAMKVKYCNETHSIVAGENIMYDIVLCEGENELQFQGTGKVTMIYRGGML